MISIALATYNGERYIRQQLESIMFQTLPFDELVVCDDGSTDRTVDIVKSFKDDRIKIYQNRINLGYIKNFSKAISKTNGDYIFLSDQDDIWVPEKLKIMMDFIQEKRACLVCTGCSMIDADGKNIINKADFQINPLIKNFTGPYRELSTFDLAFGNVAQGCTYCFRKEVKDVFLRVGNEEVIHDYQLALISSVVGKAFYLNRKLIKYRLHGTNAIGLKKKSRAITVNFTFSKEPFMCRFFRQVNSIVRVKYYELFLILYYLRIPFAIAILRRKMFAE